jgi:hypothetical protein
MVIWRGGTEVSAATCKGSSPVAAVAGKSRKEVNAGGGAVRRWPR